MLSKLGAKAGDDWWDEKRWNSELSDDIYALAVFTTKTIGENQAKVWVSTQTITTLTEPLIFCALSQTRGLVP